MHKKLTKKNKVMKQRGGIVPMAMLGPALMMAGLGRKTVKYAGKKNSEKFEER